jgi:hypothetical protein
MALFLRVAAATLALCCINPSASAGLVLLDDSTGNGGAAFESGSSFVISGVTISATTSTTLGDLTSVFSANGSGSGVNSGGISGAADGASAVDSGEHIVFEFSFPSNLIVSLSSFDFSGVGSSEGGDGALVSHNGGADILLETGAGNFNGSSDLWTPGLMLSSGDTLRIGAESQIVLEAFTLDVTAVPESTSLLFCSVGFAACFGFRKIKILIGSVARSLVPIIANV